MSLHGYLFLVVIAHGFKRKTWLRCCLKVAWALEVFGLHHPALHGPFASQMLRWPILFWDVPGLVILGA